MRMSNAQFICVLVLPTVATLVMLGVVLNCYFKVRRVRSAEAPKTDEPAPVHHEKEDNDAEDCEDCEDCEDYWVVPLSSVTVALP